MLDSQNISMVMGFGFILAYFQKNNKKTKNTKNCKKKQKKGKSKKDLKKGNRFENCFLKLLFKTYCMQIVQ